MFERASGDSSEKRWKSKEKRWRRNGGDRGIGEWSHGGRLLLVWVSAWWQFFFFLIFRFFFNPGFFNIIKKINLLIL